MHCREVSLSAKAYKSVQTSMSLLSSTILSEYFNVKKYLVKVMVEVLNVDLKIQDYNQKDKFYLSI